MLRLLFYLPVFGGAFPQVPPMWPPQVPPHMPPPQQPEAMPQQTQGIILMLALPMTLILCFNTLISNDWRQIVIGL